MKQPEYAPRSSDRISTREELFEVLELLGGFGEPQDGETESACDLFMCLDTDTANEERLLMEIEPFAALRSGKAERIN